MSKPSYRRDNSPPIAGPRLRVIRFKKNERANVSLLGTVIHGFWTHYSARTEPCTDPVETCIGCINKWPSRWKGYIHAIREDRAEEGFLEVTAKNRDDILAYCGRAELMRGQRFLMQRGNGDKTSLRILPVRSWAAENPDVPMATEHDPEETLRALFEFKRARSSSPPPSANGNGGGYHHG